MQSMAGDERTYFEAKYTATGGCLGNSSGTPEGAWVTAETDGVINK